MMMWQQTLIPKDALVRDAVAVIDSQPLKIAHIVDEDRRLIGTVTDGDVRRALLRNVPQDAPALDIAQRQPVVAGLDATVEQVQELIACSRVYQVPIVDAEGRIVGVEVARGFLSKQEKPNPVVVMAGGLGSRLYPLTKATPKPLLEVGGRPILDTIVSRFVEQGFVNIYLSVNYKAEMIKEHFGDGARFGARIQYIEEKERLGTAGALALLDEVPEAPLIVMNGDLLTCVDFEHLLAFHEGHGAVGTMCARTYSFEVPYGVVETDGADLVRINEKPTHHFFVNAGIYVLSPEALELIPKDTFYDMPTLFDTFVQQGRTSCVFPLREYWIDVGQEEDFKRANRDYMRFFQDEQHQGDEQ